MAVGHYNPYSYYAVTSVSTGPIKKEKRMSLVQKLKDLTAPKDVKLLKKYDVIDETGELTDEGIDLLNEVVFKAYKAEIVEKLEALEAAEKKEKTKK